MFTIEDHSVIGGLGGAVAELLIESEIRPRIFRRIGLPDRFASVVGDQSFLRDVYGLTLGAFFRPSSRRSSRWRSNGYTMFSRANFTTAMEVAPR